MGHFPRSYSGVRSKITFRVKIFTRGTVRVWPPTVDNVGTCARKSRNLKKGRFEHENE